MAWCSVGQKPTYVEKAYNMHKEIMPEVEVSWAKWQCAKVVTPWGGWLRWRAFVPSSPPQIH